jgi:transcriptional regulator with XRE-family HTH domain
MFPDRLRLLREKSGFSRERVAEALNIGTASIARYERGENDPTSEVLLKFARFFSVSVDYLLGVDDDATRRITRLSERELHAIIAWRRGERMEAVKVIVNDE